MSREIGAEILERHGLRICREDAEAVSEQSSRSKRPDKEPVRFPQMRLMRFGRKTVELRTEQEIAAIARQYIALVSGGLRRPLPQIAADFGLTREQARDRVHRARVLGYLEKSTPGKVSAQPGPKLLKPKAEGRNDAR